MTKEQKINFIVEQEKQHNNSWKWILKADTKTINELYEYWTQEEDFKFIHSLIAVSK